MEKIQKDQRAEEAQQLYKRWLDARQDWDIYAREDMDFYLGNHFTSDESDELQSRNQADIPMDRISPDVEKLKSFAKSDINENVLMTVLKTQSLVEEIYNGDND